MPDKIYECYMSQDGSDDVTADSFIAAETALAQTFTVGNVGENETFYLSKISLPLVKTGTLGSVTFEIRNVDGASKPNVILSQVVKTWAEIVENGYIDADATQYCEISGFDVQLSASTMYAIVIKTTGSSAGNNIGWKGEINSTYAGGAAWQSSDGGNTWVADTITDNDLDFIVYGDVYDATICDYMDVINKAGYGASSTATSVSYVNKYAKEAESVLNVLTRKNWTDIYSTINADYKYILNEIVSSLAAVKVINFDVRGYNSRLEAQQIMDNLKSTAKEYYKQLEDKDFQTFMES